MGLLGAALQIREIYAHITFRILRHFALPFFFSSLTGQTPQPISTHDGSNKVL
jgi:hypothetical protein